MRWLNLFLAVFLFFFCDKNPIDHNDNLIFGTMTDIDGNVYKTVKIGNQEWMAENLRVTRYNDGTPILYALDSTSWASDTTGAYCYYENMANTDSIKKFGAFYNWYAVNTKKLAPSGWHVPDTTDWNVLENYLITNGYNWDGTTTGNKIAKSMAANTDWLASIYTGAIGNDLTKNNKSGFSALPGGERYDGGNFYSMGDIGLFWIDTEWDTLYAWYVYLFSDGKAPMKGYNHKSCGFSVRLVRD